MERNLELPSLSWVPLAWLCRNAQFVKNNKQINNVRAVKTSREPTRRLKSSPSWGGCVLVVMTFAGTNWSWPQTLIPMWKLPGHKQPEFLPPPYYASILCQPPQDVQQHWAQFQFWQRMAWPCPRAPCQSLAMAFPLTTHHSTGCADRLIAVGKKQVDTYMCMHRTGTLPQFRNSNNSQLVSRE